ncbi:hypothetical protein DZF98_13005, partial [Clavibacter californiensis]
MTSPAPASPASDRTIGSAATAAAGAPASTYVALLVADGTHLTERVAEAADLLGAGAPAARY